MLTPQEELEHLNEVSYLKSEIKQRELLLTEKEIDKSNLNIDIENLKEIIMSYKTLSTIQNDLIRTLQKINIHSESLLASTVSIIIFLAVLLWILLFMIY